jgi:hypothetical protein
VLAHWLGTDAAIAPQSVYAYLFFHDPAGTIYERVQRCRRAVRGAGRSRLAHGTYWGSSSSRQEDRFRSAKADSWRPRIERALSSGSRRVGCFEQRHR